MDDQGSDIQIPVIEIAAGWTVDELETLDDVDDAFAYLTGALCSIDARLESVKDGDASVPPEQLRRLRSAKRWKQAALQIVQTKRGRLNREAKQAKNVRQDRQIIEFIKDAHPEVFAEALDAMKGETE